MLTPLLDLSSAPLRANEAAELLGSNVDETTAATLYEDSGGNPFYLEQLGRVVSRADVEQESARRRARLATWRCHPW